MEKIDKLTSSVQVFHSLHSVYPQLMRLPYNFILFVRLLLCPSPFGGHPIPPRFRSHCEARPQPASNKCPPPGLLTPLLSLATNSAAADREGRGRASGAVMRRAT